MRLSEQDKVIESELHQKRFTQVLLLSLVTLVILTCTSWLFARTTTSLILTLGAFTVLVIGLSWHRNRGDLHRSQGTWQLSFFICTLLLVCFAVMWLGQGLQSTAIIALPGIMIFAALVGSRKWFVASFILGILIICLVFVAGQLGWHVAVTEQQALPSLVTNLAVFTSLGLAIHWLLSDLRENIQQLRLQIKRAAESYELSRYLSENDLLTGLPNRSSAFIRFSKMQAERKNFQSLYMVVVNIDHFKRINSIHGTVAGDKILRHFASQLRSEFSFPDQVYRIGADEFLILLKRDQNGKVEQDIQKLMMLAKDENQEDKEQGLGLSFCFSAGIARWPNDAQDASELFAAANLALNEAKRQGRDCWCYYYAQLRVQQEKDACITKDLQQALKEAALEVQYQPIVDLQQNKITKCEALLRWTHPNYGALAPSYFVALAESSGLIHQLGDFVLNKACQDLAEINRQKNSKMIVCVNVSVSQLVGEPFVQGVLQCLANHQLSPSSLELEITEEVFSTQHQQVLATIRALAGHGVSFAIDDFGTGYSNLINLQRFEVNTLKIDRSLITNLHQNKNNRALVTAVIQMAQSLNLALVAEGIEYVEEASLLSDLGCDSGQGYYWSQAKPIKDILQLSLDYDQPTQMVKPTIPLSRGAYDGGS